MPSDNGYRYTVAVIGLGCRLPGDVHSPVTLWQALSDGRDMVGEVFAERWDADSLCDTEPGVPGKSISRWGGFLTDVAGFEAEFFGISPAEAELMDPAQRTTLEVAWETLGHAGIIPETLAGSSTGVFMGASHNDDLPMLNGSRMGDRPYTAPEAENSMIAGKISYFLGVRGPSRTVDTTCSSSLTAIHLACRSVPAGECDLALAGEITVLCRPETAIAFSGFGMLPADGRCSPFDASGDGFVRSEGCAMVALKSVRQARRNGDRILAVIVGSGVNHDRRTNGIIAPSATAQEAMIRQAVAAAGVEASTVGLVETHGTGTPVGDPIELSALHAVYRSGDQLCALGAIKGNTGHIGSASGAISLVKTVLALRVGTVPANLHCREWNPEITPNGSRLFIPTVSAPWPVTAGPHRAGVSSFGFNGSNAHVVLEQDPQAAVNRPPHALPSPRLFMVSASAPRALALSAGDLADWLQGAGAQADLTDVAYTLARRREHRASRLAVTATDRAELVERLRCVARGESAPGAVTDTVRGRGGRPVWVFPGQGAQWLGMGRTLLATQPEFAAMIDEVEPWVRAEAGFSVRAALTAETLVTGINRVLPVIFAIQVALAAAWRARGVRPAAVIGHSLGEATAAVVAGALSLADGVRAICRRAQLLRRISGRGAMASVKLPPEQVRQELATAGIDNVTIAVWTSPQRTVVSGDKTGVERLVEQWLQRRLVVRRVNIDVAAHCAQLDPVLADMDRSLSDLAPLGPPTIPIYSTVLDDPRGLPAFDGSYWVDNIRRPVRFSAAVAAAIADGHRVFTELSQHPVLTRAITETAEDAGCSVAALATLRCGQDEQEAMLAAVAAVHCAGVTVDWVSSHPAGALVDAPLPR